MGDGLSLSAPSNSRGKDSRSEGERKNSTRPAGSIDVSADIRSEHVLPEKSQKNSGLRLPKEPTTTYITEPSISYTPIYSSIRIVPAPNLEINPVQRFIDTANSEEQKETIQKNYLVKSSELTSLVTSPSGRFVAAGESGFYAKKISVAADQLIDELSLKWFGNQSPSLELGACIGFKVGDQFAPNGATIFNQSGKTRIDAVFVKGSFQEIMTGVLPHEICHVLFRAKFGRTLPMWANEGAASFSESKVDLHLYNKKLASAFKKNSDIPLEKVLTHTDEPLSKSELITFYAQAQSVTQFLVGLKENPNYPHSGKRGFLRFIEDTFSGKPGSIINVPKETWNHYLSKHYGAHGIHSISDLSQKWKASISEEALQQTPDTNTFWTTVAIECLENGEPGHENVIAAIRTEGSVYEIGTLHKAKEEGASDQLLEGQSESVAAFLMSIDPEEGATIKRKKDNFRRFCYRVDSLKSHPDSAIQSNALNTALSEIYGISSAGVLQAAWTKEIRRIMENK